MRLFIALNFAEETVRGLLAVQQRLRAAAPGSFSRPCNLHLTLAFLGEQPPARLPAARRALEQTELCPLALCFDHMGRFDQDGGALWWAGLRANDALGQIREDLADRLRTAGFALDRRPFSPHLTLARRVDPHRSIDPAALLPRPLPARAETVALMESARVRGALTYTPLFVRNIPSELFL